MAKRIAFYKDYLDYNMYKCEVQDDFVLLVSAYVVMSISFERVFTLLMMKIDDQITKLQGIGNRTHS